MELVFAISRWQYTDMATRTRSLVTVWVRSTDRYKKIECLPGENEAMPDNAAKSEIGCLRRGLRGMNREE